MKTPRELLLEKHQPARQQLDERTRRVVRQIAPPSTATRPKARWSDWFWPSRLAWGALAAAWVVIIGLHLASPEPRPKRVAMSRPSPEAVQALRDQRQLFVELLAPAAHESQPDRPRKRSDVHQSPPSVLS